MDSRVRSFLVWLLLGLLAFVGFYGAYWWSFEQRYMQRLVPWLCLIDAVGALAIWNGLIALRRSRSSRFVHTLTIGTQGALLGVGLLCTGYLAAYRTTLDEWMSPTEMYFKLVSSHIPESDALVISNFGCFLADHFLVGYTRRTYLPLMRQNAPDWLQWRTPPHPEWVAEDLVNRDNFNDFLWGRYKRMYENGAMEIYPYDAIDNPGIIDGALLTGRKVYFVSAGLYDSIDAEGCEVLFSRYYVKAIGVGFSDSSLPAPSQRTGQRFLFSRVVAIADPVGPYLNVLGRWASTDEFAIAQDGRLLPR